MPVATRRIGKANIGLSLNMFKLFAYNKLNTPYGACDEMECSSQIILWVIITTIRSSTAYVCRNISRETDANLVNSSERANIDSLEIRAISMMSMEFTYLCQ